ncbi:Probable formyltetrahydrofolate deformylase [Mycobacteroides abscessus]|nr:Probable formyltetrahydrofolate deformylase [Mycobacteroides abscessus]
MFPQGMHPTGSSDAFHSKDIGRLLLQCPDRIGVVAAVSAFLAEAGASIISLAQYSTEPQGGWFMQRTVARYARAAPGRRRHGGVHGGHLACPVPIDL